ncbi:putative G-type lectin S-receptor-like serine/threonine-protein kinase At1g61610 isoform X2 [Wolffia australiana]
MERLFYTLVLILSATSPSLIPSAAAKDLLTVGETLGIDEVLVSAIGTFTLGFFTPGKNASSRARNRYLGLWYSSIPDTILWVANREQPLVDSGAFLTLTGNGNLALVDGNKRSVWSTSVTSASNDTVAVLLETGNLVLKRGDNTPLWESFDYPADTLIRGMGLRLNVSTLESNKLVTWKSADDPSPGDVFFQSRNYGLFLFNKTEIIWRSNVWNGNNKPWVKNNSVVDGVQAMVQVSAKTTGFYIHLIIESGSLPAKFSIDSGGTFRFMVSQTSRSWQNFQNVPDSYCERYGRCGTWATCDDYTPQPTCKCLDGFIPKKKVEWDNGIFTAGCERRTQLEHNNGDKFLPIEKMKAPNNFSVAAVTTEAECKSMCISSSECTAYLFQNVNATSLAPKCLIWSGDLLDVRTLYDGDGQNLYIRLAASEIESSPRPDLVAGENGKSNKKALRPSLISAGAVILIAVVCITIVRLRSRGNETGRSKIMKLEDIKFAGIHAGAEFSDAPMVDFRSVASATNDFSDENKLGEGGFGSVYKGKLPNGNDVAIKRLSKGSKQGQREFANEVKLIAKLQHKNLVRLLGWCNEKDEMILIYEYMRHNSLDKLVFGNSSRISWEKHFTIIKGVADGLLYLHHHSRMRIIHRDLKTSNILLDNEMKPKISDFGLAKIVEINQAVGSTRKIVGTFGYMSPEYALNGVFSEKSDVFSFGVIVMEIITGKRSTGYFSTKDSPTLMGTAWQLWCSGRAVELLDPTMKDTVSVAQALRCIHIGLLCVQENPGDRPPMNSVVSMLTAEGFKLLHPKKPGFFRNEKASAHQLITQTCSTNGYTETIVEPR